MNYFSRKITEYFAYYPTIIAIVLLIGLSSSVITYLKVSSIVKQDLLEDAGSVATALGVQQIKALSGTETDAVLPEYLDLKQRLENIREIKKDVTFFYLTGLRDNNVFFYVDSEPKNSPNYSPPGQIYTEVDPVFVNVFSSAKPIVQNAFSDRWGSWISALVPIIDPATGKVIAVFGVDMSVYNYYKTIVVYTSIPILVMLFIILLISLGAVIRKHETTFIELKSKLVFIASHEIRTPLTGINWLADSILRHPEGLSVDQKNNIALIKQHSRNLLTIINDLLDFSAIDFIKNRTTTKEVFEVVPLFDKILKNFELPLKEKSIRIVFDASVTPNVVVFGNKEQVSRMFSNLISNAVKYSKEKGTVTIAYLPQAHSDIFSIQDQGIGIPKDDTKKIFEGFFRSENAKKMTDNGTGLGLRYVTQVVEMHNGKAWCESEENVGSTFFVELAKE